MLHAPLVEHGGRGVRVRQLGGTRKGEIKLTRFLRNDGVTVEAMAHEAALRPNGYNLEHTSGPIRAASAVLPT